MNYYTGWPARGQIDKSNILIDIIYKQTAFYYADDCKTARHSKTQPEFYLAAPFQLSYYYA